ncbi:hypothetical protein KIH87_11845 [Paraneptunicella aestuarii]|uniref:hypothetical protein n=1 Tax=Paraneptunicella aestuarii TaxID=2831148 RepID=UPI001E423827|nr:hypothetical protein [Paraneptunicella aestuarii]UAA37407.1 hypothetical protein KIH87_11845 [Paraneptunicella aestuarii]
MINTLDVWSGFTGTSPYQSVVIPAYEPESRESTTVVSVTTLLTPTMFIRAFPALTPSEPC